MSSAPTLGQVGRTERTGALGRPYWRLWWASTINSVGDGAFTAALPLLAVTVTADPRDISYIAAATYLPWLLLSLPAGVIVDRHDRAMLMWRCQLFQGAVVAAVAVAAATGQVTVFFLVVASFLLGSAQVVITNAAQAALPQLVPAPLLHKANGNQYVAQTLGLLTLGPPLGSLLFVVAAALPFGFDTASFLLSAILLATLPRLHLRRGEAASMRAEMSEGLRWLRRHKLLRTLAFVLGMNTFCHQMGFATLVLLATETHHLSERDYGLILVGGGIGSIVGGLINAWIVRRLGAIASLIVSFAANALVFLGIGFAPSGGALAALLTASGLVVTVTSVVTVSLRQQIVPERLLGRVNSVYRMIGWGLMPLGSIVGGLVAVRFGLRAPFVGAGLLRFAVLALTLPALIAGARSLTSKLDKMA